MTKSNQCEGCGARRKHSTQTDCGYCGSVLDIAYTVSQHVAPTTVPNIIINSPEERKARRIAMDTERAAQRAAMSDKECKTASKKNRRITAAVLIFFTMSTSVSVAVVYHQDHKNLTCATGALTVDGKFC